MRLVTVAMVSLFGMVAFGSHAAESGGKDEADTGAEAAVLIDGPQVDLLAGEVEAEVERRVPPRDRGKFFSRSAQVRQFIDQLYLVKAAAADARAAGLDDDPLVRAQIARAVDEVLAGAKVRQLLDAEMPDDFVEAARERYQANPEKFRRPERAEVRHILIRTDSREEPEAREKAEALRRRALDGEDFAALAREHSEDKGTAGRGGRYGPFTRKEAVKPFADAAFALEEGGISDVVQTRFGFHVIRLEKRMPSDIAPFEVVKGAIIKDLRKEFSQRIREDYFIGLRDDPAIQVRDEAIEGLVERYRAEQREP